MGPNFRSQDVIHGAAIQQDKAGIAMHTLSHLPKKLHALRDSDDYAASLVRKYPTRFGMLAALPKDNPEAAHAGIDRVTYDLHADGFAVTCNHDEVILGDPSLESVWAELNRRHAVVVHPNAYAPASMRRPSPLIEVAFQNTRTVVDIMHAGAFRKFP